MQGTGASSTWVTVPRRKIKMNRRVHLRARTEVLAKLQAHEQRQEMKRARRQD